MHNFPVVSSDAGLTVPKMRLRDYALFSECCLKSNPHITPSNCLEHRALEKAITKPFRLTLPKGKSQT